MARTLQDMLDERLRGIGPNTGNPQMFPAIQTGSGDNPYPSQNAAPLQPMGIGTPTPASIGNLAQQFAPQQQIQQQPQGTGMFQMGGQKVSLSNIGTQNDPFRKNSTANMNVASFGSAPTASLDPAIQREYEQMLQDRVSQQGSRAGMPGGLTLQEYMQQYGQDKDPGAMMEMYNAQIPHAINAGYLQRKMAEPDAMERMNVQFQQRMALQDVQNQALSDRMLAIQNLRNKGTLEAAMARNNAGGAFNSVSPEDSAILEKGIAEGRIDPSRINSRTAKIFAEMERAGGGTTNYVGASGNVKYQNAQSNLNSRALAEGVQPLYDKLLATGKALGNSSIPGYNKIVNWAKEQSGNPEIVAFNNLRDDTIAESERVLLGSGVLSDSKYLRAVKNVNSAQSYPQLEAAVKQLRTVVDARLHALDIKPFQNKGGAQGGVVGSTPQKSARSVVRTGTHNGKKVIQYSDGSVEYGE